MTKGEDLMIKQYAHNAKIIVNINSAPGFKAIHMIRVTKMIIK